DQRVPVIGRGYGDGVELLVLQGRADVLHALGRVAGELLDRLRPRAEEPAVRVDQISDLAVLHLGELIDVRAAAAVDAGHADADHVVGAQHPAGRLRAGDREHAKGGAGSGGRFDELTAGDAGHGRLLVNGEW